MKFMHIIITLLLIFSGFARSYAQPMPYINNHIEYDSIKAQYYKLYPDSIKSPRWYKQFKRGESNRAYRNDASGRQVPAAKQLKEYLKFLSAQSNNKMLKSYQWEQVGPYGPGNTGNYDAGYGVGRVNSIAVNKENDSIIYIGSASAGLWKTTDLGNTWEQTYEGFLSMGISDIAISDTDPNIIYAVTGDADGGAFFGCYSMGLIKSTNAGVSWTYLNSNTNFNDKTFISKVIISPRHSQNIIFTSGTNGIQKSSDGGNNWETVLDSINIRDLVFKPGDANIIYASSFETKGNAAVYSSDDGGESWYAYKYFPNASRIKLAVCPESPESVWALCTDYRTQGSEGLYVSHSEAVDWEKIEVSIDIIDKQGFYNSVLSVNPKNPDEIYAGGVTLYHTSNSGQNWQIVQNLHVDNHDFAFSNSNKIFSANDGGIYISGVDSINFKNISYGLPITQFYRVGVNEYNPNELIAGSQDNSAMYFADGLWNYIFAGDGMESVFSKAVPEMRFIVYQNSLLFRQYDNAFLSISEKLGKGEWSSPLIQSYNGLKLLFGTKEVYQSTDFGINWGALTNFNDNLNIVNMAYPNNNDTVLAFSRKDGIYKLNKGQLKRIFTDNSVYATSLCFAENSDNVIWACFGGFKSDLKVIRLENDTNINITYNLPNIPCSSIVYDKFNKRLCIGTDFGIMYLDSGSSQWLSWGNFPLTIVRELEINESSADMYAATFGRGLFKTKIADIELPQKPVIIPSKTGILCFGDSIVLKSETYNPDYQYIWSDGTKGTETVSKLSGCYFLTVINKSGAVAVSDIYCTQIINEPERYIRLLSRNPECEGTPIKLQADYNPVNFDTLYFQWSNGDTNKIANFNQSGEYYYILTTSGGCISYSDTVYVSIIPNPEKPLITRKDNFLYSSHNLYNEWYYNGAPAYGERFGNSYYAALPGVYNVIARNQNYCSSVSDNYVFMTKDTNDTFIVNLTQSADNMIKLDVYTKIDEEISIGIFDATGKEVYFAKRKSEGIVQIFTIDMQGAAQGAYYAVISAGNKLKRKQFIISR